MKIKIIVLLITLYSACSIAQVGVNNKLPLHPFHLDGKGNNLSTANPTPDEANDDFVITKDGNIGIGVFNPSVRLEVNGNVRITDGNQGLGKVLTSNEDGVGTIKLLPEAIPAVVGVFAGENVVNTANGTGHIYANTSIKLRKGKWIVTWGLTIDNKGSNNVWLESCLSSSTAARAEIGFTFIGGTVTNKPSIGANLQGNSDVSKANFDMVIGSTLINVTNDSIEVFVLIKKDGNWSFSPSSWENYMYALPIK
ncbi:hypothetical protein [Myroides sp. N17-2]|uniref:hypothetical protein n=1 Tax=Myroides sp. N17-2 TaxID=2030799 RepID=UPI000EFA381E|nr:hypothetical protein [Myroides sp. N17-2]